ncbi:IS1249 family transposase [Veillonella criceti]|uniref:Transposase and inactivated derivatives n=1 Tax=Veillonella criceti TaxID=103891 RepID=A0A380NMY9_9FIRM|nr:IS1249 family transposase [Veillonella criceti]SUP37080.1 Transposase and inactivated derivatives [Veillonella criceti]SUP45116.1 Transposase and inactivated derivatives [Veillonella criceti]
MRIAKCPNCGRKSIKHGILKSGSQRWFCKGCKVAFTLQIDTQAKSFKSFLNWLFSKEVQKDMLGQGHTFRRSTKRFWSLWPLPPKIDEPRDVVYVDGIYLSRKLCVLICCDDMHVLGWYVCRTENSRAWTCLIERIAEPKVVISDGGPGFAKALKSVWPLASHQRCLFHAFCQVRRYTTSRPKTMAGRDLYLIARELFWVKTSESACAWIEKLRNWRTVYNTFLQEMTTDENGNKRSTHERLLKAESSLLKLVKQHTLFTFIEMADISVPTTNNYIEGGVNAQLRDMLRSHRGLSLERRLKAVYWWCYMHSPRPLSISEILKVMPTDESISLIYQRFNERNKVDYSIPQWGDGLAWNELHKSTEFPTYWD